MPEIDLSQLPAPDVVEELDYEAILAEIVADFLGREPEYDAFVESDPALKLLEVAAYREMLLRWRINEAAKSVMLAFAKGSNLDQLTALADVERQEGESDERLLTRFRLSLEAKSAAGPAGAYEFYALSADPSIRSVTPTTPTPGNVRLVVIGGANPDGLPTPALIAKVVAALDAETVRPLTDTVEVLAARNILYQVTVTITVEDGPDTSVVRAAAEAKIRAYLLSVHRVGRTVEGSAILAAAHVAGVTRAQMDFYSGNAKQTPTGNRLTIASLSLPADWANTAAFWPGQADNADGGSVETPVAGWTGVQNPVTVPADGLTVTVA